MCTRIDGVTIGSRIRYACINDRILVPGDKAIPSFDVRISEITPKEIVFELENVKVKYVVTPFETNDHDTATSPAAPTKDQEKKTP